MLGVSEDEITIEERSRAKAVNFGVIYGMSSFGLSSELNITRKNAEEYINAYFDKHRAVKEFMDSQVEFCREATEKAHALKKKEKHENSRVFIPAEPAEDTEE